MFMKRLQKLLAGAACAAILTATATAAVADSPPIRFAVGVDPAFTPIFLAKHEKMFEEAGLNVQLQQFTQSNEGLDSINAGLTDLVGAAEPGTLTRITRGDIRPLAIYEQSGKYIKLVVKDGISDVKQIKKFGIVPGSVSEYATHKLLDKFKIDLQSVQLITAGPPELPALLANKSIDAFFAWEPWPSVGIRQGGKVLMTSADVGYTYTMWLSANGSWLDKHRDEAKKVVATLAKACAVVQDGIAKNDLSRPIAANRALAKLPPDQTTSFLRDVECVVRDFTSDDLESYDQIATFLHQAKMTPVKADFRKVMQLGFFKE